jgi:putative endonuclease
MKYYVYIIYSEKCDRYYVGHSDDVERRFDEHNSGRGGKYTSSCKPWELMNTETYESKTSAVNREIEIKNKKSRKYIERLIKKKNQNDISSAGYSVPMRSNGKVIR